MEIGYKNEEACCFCKEIMGSEGGLHSGDPTCWRGMPINSHSHFHCYIHYWMDCYMLDKAAKDEAETKSDCKNGIHVRTGNYSDIDYLEDTWKCDKCSATIKKVN